jgi:hypothetical protein
MGCLLVLSTFASLVACNSGTPPPAATLDARIQGWWISSAQGTCDSACTVKPATPECGQADCVQWDFLGFKGQTAYDGVVSYSAKAGTMSTVLGVIVEGYTLDTNAATLKLGNGQTQQVTCSESTMTLGYGSLTRASSSVGAAFESGVQSGPSGWRGLAVK